jgi:hypothetical protein
MASVERGEAGRIDMDTNPNYERLIKIIGADKTDLVDLCLQLGNTPSPHGNEPVLARENRVH